MTKVMIFGTFDVFHPGHEFVLQEACKRGTVTVVIGRDQNVRYIKRRFPQQSEHIRKDEIQKRFPSVHVVLGDPDDFLMPVRTYKPDLILLGYDQELPPGVTVKNLGVPVERLKPHHPEKYKSSLHKKS